jgi:hypothetical protein
MSDRAGGKCPLTPRVEKSLLLEQTRVNVTQDATWRQSRKSLPAFCRAWHERLHCRGNWRGAAAFVRPLAKVQNLTTETRSFSVFFSVTLCLRGAKGSNSDNVLKVLVDTDPQGLLLSRFQCFDLLLAVKLFFRNILFGVLIKSFLAAEGAKIVGLTLVF